MRRVLLLQARKPNDPMEVHEKQCVAQRLDRLKVDLQTRTVISAPADPAWLQGVDAVIIGGSGRYSVHHPKSTQWVTPLRRVLEVILQQAIPCFGICFGHQLLGLHLGAQVVTDPTLAEVGTITITLNQEGQSDPVFGHLGGTFFGHTGHSDAVDRIPEGVALLGSSEVLETQVFKVTGQPFYSTQFHPDITGAEAKARYRAYQKGFAVDIPEATLEKISRFTEGDDDTSNLLAQFIREVT
jgi:GMP synthase (glutamine-hydrolysing)